MFGSSRAGQCLRLGWLTIVTSLPFIPFLAHSQSTPEVIPRAAMAAQLPVAPYIPLKEVMSAKAGHIVTTQASTPLSTVGHPSLDVRAEKAHKTSVTHTTPDTPNRWEVRTSDITLYRTIERWTQAAGYKLKWDASKNFLIGAPDVYSGSFEMALYSALSSSGIRLSDYPLEACIYANNPPLVRITRQGEQARECAAVD